MKVGRNDPCPCGSGRKYKHCCLDKETRAPETLAYRRFSRAFDEVLPLLVEHGVSVFGKAATEFALAEFFRWPEPDEEPDEDVLNRADTLFWPWFVFNWEYSRIEDEEELLERPEETTIAELFLASGKIDPQSPECLLIRVVNRVPYSFLEVVAVEPGRSVTVRDLLTGAETKVEEHIGTETMDPEEILFGRVAMVDGTGMFFGLSTFIIPPIFKPLIIQLRQSLNPLSEKVTPDLLNELDMEVRELFLEIDRVLHLPPRDGIIDSEAMPDQENSGFKVGRPASEAQISAKAESTAQIEAFVAAFGAQRLNETYTGYALALCEAAEACPDLNFHRGRTEIWAAAIVYAIAQLNFLFSAETPNHLTADELCRWFGVKKTTAAQKAGKIREVLNLFHDDDRFCAPQITRFFQFSEDENGFLHPAADLSADAEKEWAPPPLKAPEGRQDDAAPAVVTPPVKEKPKPPGGGQLKLFED